MLGAAFETINSPRNLNENTFLRRLIDREIEHLSFRFAIKEQQNNTKTEIETTITTFNTENPTHRPTNANTHLNFTNPQRVARILGNLPIKTSHGLNNIPPIVFKHLPPSMIID